MKAHVYVTMKKTVLDPQGATIARALNSMGHPEIAAVRQGKYFAIDIADGTPKETVAANLDKIAAEILSNPVIEEYRVELID
jgi:phosphoribosylformylglycinamidine synthase subunit PurS